MNAISKICIAAVLLAAVNFVPCIWAQNYTARLDLEESTDGLSSWHRVPITAGMLNNGSVDLNVISSSAFYRLKVVVASTPTPTTNLFSVTGGTLPSSSRFSGESVPTFQIAKYETTWDEWKEVREWAVSNGYDLTGVGEGSLGDHPVNKVNYFEIVKWCNAKSQKNNLTPVYLVNGVPYKYGVSYPAVDSAANGYRLPIEKEWEWAARGGVSSQGYIYSGSNYGMPVAWYYDNSNAAAVNMYNGRGTWPVGTKTANELGIHDMSGNVWEWCEDRYSSIAATRVIRSGSYKGNETACSLANRYDAYNDVRINDLGFRIARNAP